MKSKNAILFAGAIFLLGQLLIPVHHSIASVEEETIIQTEESSAYEQQLQVEEELNAPVESGMIETEDPLPEEEQMMQEEEAEPAEAAAE